MSDSEGEEEFDFSEDEEQVQEIPDEVLNRLLPHQIKHFRDSLFKITNYQRLLDTSMMGCGKTYSSCAIAKVLNLDLTVFAPANTLTGWKNACLHFDITEDRLHFHSYSEFQRKVKPYLESYSQEETEEVIRLNQVKGNTQLVGFCAEADDILMKPNQEWNERLNAGTILILDECHWLKNVSNRSKMLIMLSQALFNHNDKILKNQDEQKRSYLLCLSATPFDKPEHSVRLMKVMSIIKKAKLSQMNPHTGVKKFVGLKELIDYCNKIDTTGQNQVSDWISEKKAKEIAYDMVVTYIKPKMFVAMPPVKTEFQSDTKNYFCKIEGEDLKVVERGVNLMKHGVQTLSDGRKKSKGESGSALGNISKGMKIVEEGKITTFIDQAYRVLMSNENTKVIVMLNYSDSLAAIADGLYDFDPIVINGQTPRPKRADMLKSFQEKSTNQRVLVCNLSILAQGVDLDDKDGNFPRTVFISPNYHVVNLHQATGRVLRSNTKSHPLIRFIYADKTPQEMLLLHRLAEKSNVVRSGLSYEVLLPGDYPKLYEKDLPKGTTQSKQETCKKNINNRIKSGSEVSKPVFKLDLSQSKIEIRKPVPPQLSFGKKRPKLLRNRV